MSLVSHQTDESSGVISQATVDGEMRQARLAIEGSGSSQWGQLVNMVLEFGTSCYSFENVKKSTNVNVINNKTKKLVTLNSQTQLKIILHQGNISYFSNGRMYVLPFPFYSQSLYSICERSYFQVPVSHKPYNRIFIESSDFP